MKRKSFFVGLFFTYALSITFTASVLGAESLAQAVKQGTAKSYIVIMANDPAISYDGDVAGLSATKPGKGGKINPNSAHVRKYQKFLEKSHSASLAKAGVDQAAQIHSYTIALNGYSAILTEEEVKALKHQDGVLRVLEDVMRYPDTDASPGFLGLGDPGGAYEKEITGEGVVVGVIDSGIWPEHPSFADDGSYSVPSIMPLDDSRPECEFGNTAHNPLDAPFTCNNKLLGARQMLDTYRFFIGADPDEYDSARDDSGHGTHTASTAAGNSGVSASMFGIDRGIVSGIAPRAHVIAYKGLGDLGGFTSDLASAIDQAVADGVDVINYSVGGGAGAPGGDEIAFLFADDAGVFVATSAGNSGPGTATLGNPGTMPWLTTVGASTQARFFQGTATTGDSAMYPGASITSGVGSSPLVDAADVGGDLCIPGTLDPFEVAGKVVLCRRGAIARVGKSMAVMAAGGVGMIMYNNSDVDNLYSDNHFVPSVHIDNTPGLAIKAYIVANGAAATAGITGEELGTWPFAPSMTIFSSRGENPVSPDIIKPDITAPGHQVLAGTTPTPIGGVPGELFQAISGTSMSSPHIAGIGALLTQAHPDWSPAMIRSAMMTTAHQDVVDNDRVSPADPFDYGAGHVNTEGQWIKGSIAEPGLAYDAGLFEYAAYTCGADFGVFTPGSCDFLESIGVPSDASDLNLPSIGIEGLAGSQTVQRTVTSVARENGHRTYNVSVDAPAGFSVSVNPSTIKLRRGETATYEVTITNLGAPIGEWRFGSLTWDESNGLYSVYSPIAVSAALFSTEPAVVVGTGASGSASIDVSFGYTGSYAATPHGMVADAPAFGVIGQDPDQTYPSGDDAPGPAGGVDRIDFIVAGAAFLRWKMVMPGADDIDLFLENSGGTIIAASTSGGTDELIELVLPADDTYTMVVHGWSVPSAPLAYTLSYWEVPLVSGGSLSVDSAPASAVSGTSGVVDISWTGLASGEHLGVIGHVGPGPAVIGGTLVEVSVP
jgi:subtilisin family serine protease